MQLAERIAKTRFVGREFLLWLWMESELGEGTLRTRAHGEVGLWLDKTLVLSAGAESTRVTAPMPGLGREAKEALLRGQLPDRAGLRIAHARGGETHEASLVLAGETLAIRGLRLQTELDAAGDEGGGGAGAERVPGGDLVDELRGRGRPGRRKRVRDDGDDAEAAAEDAAFYERMTLAREVEAVLADLFLEFLELRLSPRWDAVVVPALRRWARGEPVDAARHRAALAGSGARSASEGGDGGPGRGARSGRAGGATRLSGAVKRASAARRR